MRNTRKRLTALLVALALTFGVTAFAPTVSHADGRSWTTCHQAASSGLVPGNRMVCIDLVNSSRAQIYTGGMWPSTSIVATVNPFVSNTWFSNICRGRTFHMMGDSDWFTNSAGWTHFVDRSWRNSGNWTVNYYHDFYINIPQNHHLIEFYSNVPGYDLVVICQ